jgi:RNA polymerase primary sigma factor
MKKKDKSPDILSDIVSSAKKRGYITQDEILAIFPRHEEHLIELDHLYDKLLE